MLTMTTNEVAPQLLAKLHPKRYNLLNVGLFYTRKDVIRGFIAKKSSFSVANLIYAKSNGQKY